eukprot:SAG22_NODE_80_length_21788_cov_9.742542_2_plen_1130_part_00
MASKPGPPPPPKPPRPPQPPDQPPPDQPRSPSRASSRIAAAQKAAAAPIEGPEQPTEQPMQVLAGTLASSSSGSGSGSESDGGGGGSRPSPRQPPRLGRYACVKKAVLRSGVEMDSFTTGDVQAGETVDVTEWARTAAKNAAGNQQLRGKCSRGWISLTAASSGAVLFRKCPDDGALVTQGVVVVNATATPAGGVAEPPGERKNTPPGAGAEAGAGGGVVAAAAAAAAADVPAPKKEKESKFQGRHMDFLRNMAANRRKAEKQVAAAAEKGKARKQKLAKKVSQICQDVLASSASALPPQQRSLLKASQANTTMFANRRKGGGRRGGVGPAADAGGAQRGSSAGGVFGGGGGSSGYSAKTFSLERAALSASTGSLLNSAGNEGGGAAGGFGASSSLSLRRSKALAAAKGKGRAGVVFDSEVDASWNVQAHSLQRRMWPENYDEEKASFLADPLRHGDPQFEYQTEVEAQQRERFPVCKRWLPQAERLLDAIVKECGSDQAFHKAVTAKRKAVAERASNGVGGEDAPAWNTPMTPEELVASAEAFLRKCLSIPSDPENDILTKMAAEGGLPGAGGGEGNTGTAGDDGASAGSWAAAAAAASGEAASDSSGSNGSGGRAAQWRQAEWVDSVVEKLTVHFSQRNKGRSMSVRGCTLNVPLPITLSACRADTIWFHELGTHFLRNAVNEPIRKAAGGELGPDRRGSGFGGASGLSAHAARMKASRSQGSGGAAAASARKEKLRAQAQQAEAYAAAVQEAAVPGAEMVVLNRAVVRVAYALDSEVAAEFNGQLLPGEVIVAKEVVDPAGRFPCSYSCVRRAVLRRAASLESEQVGHVEVGETVTVTQSATAEATGQLRLQVEGGRGWTSALTASGDRLMAKAAGQPRVAFERGGKVYWVSTATGDGRPLLMQKALLAKPELLTAGRKGTRAERFASHLREQEEHTSEEGLAITNQYMAEADCRMWRPALMYYACARASELGFADLFQHLAKYVTDPEKRWAVCARVKGGLTDTSKPGAFCRDQAYWGGAVTLLANRNNIDLLYMHMGRVNLAEAIGGSHGRRFAAAVDDAKQQKLACQVPRLDEVGAAAAAGSRGGGDRKDHFVFPCFVGDMEAYQRKLAMVAKANMIEEISGE